MCIQICIATCVHCVMGTSVLPLCYASLYGTQIMFQGYSSWELYSFLKNCLCYLLIFVFLKYFLFFIAYVGARLLWDEYDGRKGKKSSVLSFVFIIKVTFL